MADKKLTYRIMVLLFVWFTQIRQQLLTIVENGWHISDLDRNKTLTIQVNYFIAIWLLLWVLWRNQPEKEGKLNGSLKGALTVYITLVMLAYHFLISSTDATFYSYSNFAQHYILPILFIIDWFLFEREEYEWRYIIVWAIYPLGYAGFALLNGQLGLSSGYIYGFLDPIAGSWASVITMIVAIFIFYLILAILYIGINRKYTSSLSSD